MHTPTLLARLCAAVVLIAPLSLFGATNAEALKDLNLTKYVEPAFPDSVRVDGLAEGHVALAISRDAAGVPGDILVLESTHPQLAKVALEAVREWRFQPSDNPADLKSRTVRIGFKLMGVVIYPYGKNHIAEPSSELSALKLADPVRVPALQGLAQVPKALVQPMPAYPTALTNRKVAGHAAVRFYVDEEGRVRQPQVVEATAPEFADAALAAVAQWRYEPPQEGERSVVVADNWSFQFKANN